MKWKTEYTVISIIAGLVITIIVMTFVWSSHECPKPTKPEITEKNLKKIKQIQDAETKEDIDSLLIELYGFKSK